MFSVAHNNRIMQKEIEILDLSANERDILAKKADINPVYLWQCGAGMRTPSLALAEKLIKYESRLTITSLMAPKHRRNSKQKKTN